MTRVVAFVPDLMDRSRLTAAGVEVSFVGSPGALVSAGLDGVDVVVVDLDRPGVLDVLASIPVRTIGFGSHVDHDLLDAARAAGCDEVLARSTFFRRVGELAGPAP